MGLSESWHNFDQLWVVGGMAGHDDWIESIQINVDSALSALESGANNMVIWSGGESNWRMVSPSSDGMTFNNYQRSGNIKIYSIMGINFN